MVHSQKEAAVAKNNFNPTMESFSSNMKEMVSEIKNVVKKGENGRARFPDFTLTNAITEKLHEANGLLIDGDISAANAKLEDARRHFRNQQAAYTRGQLAQSLDEDIGDMIKRRWPEEVISPARQAIDEFREMVFSDRFDLNDASNTFWKAIDALNTAEEEMKKRVAQANEIAREQRVAAAQGLEELIGSISSR